MDEVKRCPFCGGVGTLWSTDCCNTVYAVCMKCGIRTLDHKKAEEAIAAWNRRVERNNPLDDDTGTDQS